MHSPSVVIMITPHSPAPEAATNSDELCVPLSAVQVDGQSPAAGDPVEGNLAGTVSRVEGEKVYLKDATFNGEPIPAKKAAAPAAEPDMLEEAKKADEESEGMGY